MAVDQNYFRLAQLSTKKSPANEVIEEILNTEHINYQIPINTIQVNPLYPLFLRYLKVQGCTALHIVAQDLDAEATERLINRGADCSIKNSLGETALHQAILNVSKSFSKPWDDKLYPVIKAILKTHVTSEVFENPCDKNGLSHFHAACVVDCTDVVKFFIEKNVSVNESINMDSPYVPGYTPLHFAARYGRVETFKILLDGGADAKAKDGKGLVPLHLLIQRIIQIADCLHVEKKTLNDYIKREFEDNVRMIEEAVKEYKNAPSGMIDDTGLSFFHAACMFQDSADILKLMLSDENIKLEHSVKADSQLWPGYTALHFAAHFSYIAVKVLSLNGANILAKDAKGVTPLDLCLQRYQVEQIRFIIDDQPRLMGIEFYGANISLLDMFDAMSSEESFESFIQTFDVFTWIPTNSLLWPGCTPLHLTIMLAEKTQGGEEDPLYLERLILLLGEGADARVADFHGSTPIHLAFRMRKFKVVNILLSQVREFNSDMVDDENISFLHIACAVGDFSIVQNLKPSNITINLPLKSTYDIEHFNEENREKVTYAFPAGSTPLHIAVITRNVRVTELLLTRGADIHAEDAEGFTPIHRLLGLACNANELTIGSLLFSSDTLENSVTTFGLSHLHLACWTNNATAVEILLDQGADINASVSNIPSEPDNTTVAGTSKDEYLRARYKSFTPLCFAEQNKHADVIDVIFRRCNDLFADPKTVLKAACYTKKSTSIGSLHKTHPAMIERWEREFNLTTLHAACFKYDVDAVEQLLERGANPNAQISMQSTVWPGLTPLHIAMELPSLGVEDKKKCYSIAKLLLDFGADVMLKNPAGNTVIHIIHFHTKHRKLFLLLLSGQKDFTINPALHIKGMSHFHIACACNAVPVVEQFIKHGVDVNQTIDPLICSFEGWTSLHLAAFYNSEETVKLLLKYEANVHARNTDGNTPLHSAADCEDIYLQKDKKTCENIIASLLSAGANLNATNVYNQTPLEIMLEKQRPTVKMLDLLSKTQRRVNSFYASGAGFIATAIKRETNIKSIIQHPAYYAVIDSPKVNELSECGRTPIHNIVSIKKIAASTKVYTKAIEGFLKVGIDIDQQDKNGETALHAAVRCQNSKGVEALLAFGADINLLSYGRTPMYYHWKYIESVKSDMTMLLESERRTLKALWKQLYKYQLIDFAISDLDEKIDAVLKYRQLDLDLSVVEQCQVELERLESRKLDFYNVTLYNFLSETGVVASYPKMLHQERQAVDSLFQNHGFRLRQEFPEFAGILHMQYRKAVTRVSLIEPAMNTLDLLLNFDIPDLCKAQILRFLENSELENLIEARQSFILPPSKRKRIN